MDYGYEVRPHQFDDYDSCDECGHEFQEGELMYIQHPVIDGFAGRLTTDPERHGQLDLTVITAVYCAQCE